MKIKKGIPLIDQHNRYGFWGGKFGGNFIPETLKKPVEDLAELFAKVRKDKKFIKSRDYYFKKCIDRCLFMENLGLFILFVFIIFLVLLVCSTLKS